MMLSTGISGRPEFVALAGSVIRRGIGFRHSGNEALGGG
jgi:hypothetical protein